MFSKFEKNGVLFENGDTNFNGRENVFPGRLKFPSRQQNLIAAINGKIKRAFFCDTVKCVLNKC